MQNAMTDFPIIDSHIHLLDRKRFGYSWSAGAAWAASARKLDRDWSANDLASYAKPYEIEGFVFVEADVDMPQYLEEARWVTGIAERDSRVKACVACLPLELGTAVEPELAKLAENRVVHGVRRLIQNQTDPDFVLRRDFLDALKLLPQYDLSFDICILPHQFPNTIEMVRRCPDVRFVLDHMGKPAVKAGDYEPWRRHIRKLAELPNVVCKLSGLVTEADHSTWTQDQLRPYIDHVVECFGVDRVMFGADWPVIELAGTYRQWVDIVDWATNGMDSRDKRKIFRDNALAFYRLNAID